MSAFSALLFLAACAADSDAVLVEFHSQNCSPCRAMQPVVQKLADAGYPLQQIDVDAQPAYAEQFKIRSTPTFVLFSRGREVQRAEGSTSQAELAAMFQKVGYAPASSPAAAAPPPERPQQTTQGYVPNAAASGGHQQAVPPQQLAAYATVRLKIEDGAGFSFGTGTIIDRHDEEALVLTCGHIFRASQGKGKTTVDLFAPGATQPVAGQCIAYDLDRDIALVSIRPDVKVDPVPIAGADYAVQPRDRVFTIGCDKGAQPSLRNSLITSVNRYQGSPNYTADGAPIEGRSGGGLFTETGLLIGVCNAADEKGNEGLYAALASVHWQLDQIGQSAIYKKNDAAPNMAAEPKAPEVIPNRSRQPVAPPLMPPVMPAGVPLAIGPSGPAKAGTPTPGTSDDDTEVIVIVRSKSNPTKQSDIFVMDRPPNEMIRQLQNAGRPAPRGSSQDLLRSASRLGQPGEFNPTDGAPIVRGQSQP
jgi:thiol-disulfide isomerase/thioredoxin